MPNLSFMSAHIENSRMKLSTRTALAYPEIQPDFKKMWKH